MSEPSASIQHAAPSTGIRLASIQAGPARTLDEPTPERPDLKPWRSAIFKAPLAGRVRVGALGVEGDGQADRSLHGGLEMAILAYGADHYAEWRRVFEEAGVLAPGAELPFGAFGENLDIRGQTEDAVCIGDVMEIGPEVRVSVTQPRQPCWKLARRWNMPDLTARVKANGRGGWYLRVLREGGIEAGMPITLIERPHPEWTISAAQRVYRDRNTDRAAAEALAECPALSMDWRERLLTPGA